MTTPPRSRWKTVKVDPITHAVCKSLVDTLPDEDLTTFITIAIQERLARKFGSSKVIETVHDVEHQHDEAAKQSQYQASHKPTED